jgi:hypothetical protein
MKMKYKIQTLFTYGWDDECEDAALYDTKEEAEQSIKEMLKDVEYAVSKGYMDEPYSAEDYRVIAAE